MSINTRSSRLTIILLLFFMLLMGALYRFGLVNINQNESHKPNILFVFTDDQAPWALGRGGDNQAVTPNIDRLASEGMYFPNAYAVMATTS